MLEINDQFLKLAIFGYLIHQIDAGEFEPLLEAGFSADDLEKLRRRPMAELSQILALGLPVRVSIAPSELLSVGAHYDASMRELKLLDYFLKHGTHPDLAATLFSRSGMEMRTRTAVVLGGAAKPVTRGRIDPALQEAIRVVWQRLSVVNTSTVERLYALHESVAVDFPGLSVDRMCHILEKLFGTFYVRLHDPDVERSA